MIDTYTSPTSSNAAASRAAIAERIGPNTDSNRDGRVTSDEFSNFLAGLMQLLDQELETHRAPGEGDARMFETTGKVHR